MKFRIKINEQATYDDVRQLLNDIKRANIKEVSLNELSLHYSQKANKFLY